MKDKVVQRHVQIPDAGQISLPTLWKATLAIRGSREEILFRETDEFERAAKTAQKLVESSPACKMVGAMIVEVKRMAHLWN